MFLRFVSRRILRLVYDTIDTADLKLIRRAIRLRQ